MSPIFAFVVGNEMVALMFLLKKIGKGIKKEVY